ncbi:Inner membrane protein YbjJ [Streptomyces sp. RB5]|uniref:Inner membrane protein YbjJ n=1 Tax=Streptomyces smaragdinus TaxID=2585196 RepID=A0A7K0CES5_9ACTN|nr:MFS transporter [Streptomyces smaragdinus]MQY11264.1 Inner membrane protein YbjJ [Streptomyces smaragdinus]
MSVELYDRRTLLRARIATSLVFLLFGTALGTWTSRIPDVKNGIGLSDGRLSVALLAFSAGAIAGMMVLGRLTDRFGSKRLLVPAAVLEGLLLMPPAYVGSLAALVVALFLFGLTHGTLNIAMNTSALQVEGAWGRPVMSSCHAVYSIGGFLGAAAGGVLARQQVGVGATFVAVGTGVVLLACWSAAWLLPSAPAPRTAADGAGKSRTASLGLVFMGVLVMCTLVGEGTAADWSAVYLHDNLGSSTDVAAFAYAAFAAAMTAGRLAGDRLAAALGPVRLVRASSVLASTGLLTALAIGHPAAGIAGFACLGAGMACIAPQVISAAGRRNPSQAGAALALVVGLGYTGFLIGPVVVGAASTVTGLPTALVIPAVLILLVAAGASALRPRPSSAG